MFDLTKSRVTMTRDAMPQKRLAELEGEEKALVERVSARDDTALLLVEDRDKDTLIAYAVIGKDDGGMVTIYAARSLAGGAVTAMMLRGIFGASQVLGAPMRVHTDRVAAYARMIGAGEAWDAIDGDGLPMGVFA